MHASDQHRRPSSPHHVMKSYQPERRHARAWNPDVWLISALLLLFLCAVLGMALWFLRRFWGELPDAASPQASRNLEVIKTCLQVIGVVCVGAFVTLGGAALESAHRRRTERQSDRREDFETRTAILDRATRCAQGMFVACQNARRQLNDLTESTSPEAASARSEIRRALDQHYLDFGIEARAIQTIIGARYTTSESPVPSPDADCPAGIQVGEDQAWWRWHQLYDLLVVYYFSISGDFRRLVLQTNSRGYNGKFHAGYDFLNGPTFKTTNAGPDHQRIENVIRYEVPMALAEFAAAILEKPAATRPMMPPD